MSGYICRPRSLDITSSDIDRLLGDASPIKRGDLAWVNELRHLALTPRNLLAMDNITPRLFQDEATKKLAQDIVERVDTILKDHDICPVCLETARYGNPGLAEKAGILLPCGHLLHKVCANGLNVIHYIGCQRHETYNDLQDRNKCSRCFALPVRQSKKCPVCMQMCTWNESMLELA